MFPEIPPESLEIAKIASPWYFNRVQLPYETWHQGGEGALCSAPFYVSVDGLLFVVKDARKKVEEASAEEREKYGVQTAGPGKKGKGTGGAEKGLKIIVKKKATPESLPYA